jgi:probable F420-dependent oxidoreductase
LVTGTNHRRDQAGAKTGRPQAVNLDCYILGEDLETIGRSAATMEAHGHGCMWSIESQHDPFLALGVAAARTSSMRLGTNIAVAFARNPMTVAQTAHDLQQLSKGRFILGLGPQVRAHIERRFSMPWTKPVARMREFVLALKAIWAAWETGTPLCFNGEFYRHTLMAPNFDPGPSGYGCPPVYLAAVGPQMTATAGEVADGLLCHPLTTPQYLSTVMMPALWRDRETPSGRTEFPVVVSLLVATGPNPTAVETSVGNVRRKIAFYASTPAYRPILEVHGLGHLQPQLNELARQARWNEMAAYIDDDILDVFAVVGSPAEIGRTVRHRFAGLADRATLYELDDLGRLMLVGRYLAEPDPLHQLMAGFSENGVDRHLP